MNNNTSWLYTVNWGKLEARGVGVDHTSPHFDGGRPLLPAFLAEVVVPSDLVDGLLMTQWIRVDVRLILLPPTEPSTLFVFEVYGWIAIGFASPWPIRDRCVCSSIYPCPPPLLFLLQSRPSSVPPPPVSPPLVSPPLLFPLLWSQCGWIGSTRIREFTTIILTSQSVPDIPYIYVCVCNQVPFVLKCSQFSLVFKTMSLIWAIWSSDCYNKICTRMK